MKGVYIEKIKKITAAAVAAVMTVLMMTACEMPKDSGDKIKVVTTLFPQYDFARTIAGDKADVTLLLKPGTDSHSYEPTSSDMLEIANADVFVYTGKDMEAWAETVLQSADNEKLNVVDVSCGAEIDLVDDGHEHHGEEDGDHGHGIYDPHIWTNPKNAVIIAENILKSLKDVDSENGEYYEKNAENLIDELNKLDGDFEEFFNGCENKTLVFGGRFAMHYFAKHYGLDYIAAYDTCSGEGEASPGKIAYICETIRENNLKAVYYEELTDPAVAETIAAETNTKALLLHSCHNVSESDFSAGETYISLMRKNLENLKEGMR